MATFPDAENTGRPTPPRGRRRDEPMTPWRAIKLILKPVASLKLTVTLFVLLIFLIFVGTLAQAEESMWTAVGRYFYSWAVLVNFNTFFPKSFFPNMPHLPDTLFGVPIGIPAPGGCLIGVLLMVNLGAAHLVRFQMQARGLRLFAGLLITLLGILSTLFIVFTGMNADGLQGVPMFVQDGNWISLWLAIKYGLTWLTILGAGSAAAFMLTAGKRVEGVLFGAIAAATLVLFLALWRLIPDFRLDDSALRIMWQLMQGGLVAVILLIGCLLAFKQRGGMVVLHAGVGLLMVGMFYVALYAVEEQITIPEGGSSNEAIDIRKVELAVVDHSPKDEDTVIAVPQSRIPYVSVLSHESLPFDVQMVEYFPNSSVEKRGEEEETPATAGIGLRVKPIARRVGAGADSGGDVDVASAYVRLLKKGTDKEIGTYLVSQHLVPEQITVGDKSYDVELRFKTTPKPYTIHLEDVRKDDYMGTDTPMNYSSDIRLVDDRFDVDRKIKIWMNNPLRYSGETFYQTSYFMDPRSGTESTTLSVVTNSGWMMPYVACMITGIGMLAHFWIVLVRFLKRLISDELSQELRGEIVEANALGGPLVQPAQRPRKPGRPRHRPAVAPVDHHHQNGGVTLVGILLPAIVVLGAAGWLATRAIPPRYSAAQMNYYDAGKLPVMYQGRLKPLDTLARNSLRIISNYETFTDKSSGKEVTQPAIKWLLDVISGSPDARGHEVFRIDNFEVLDVLELKRRKGFRYSVEELLKGGIGKFEAEVQRAQKLRTEHPERLSTYEKKLLETDRRLRTFTLLVGAFHPPDLPDLPTREEFENDREAAFRKVAMFQQVRTAAKQRVDSTNPPLSVPGPNPDDEWQAYSNAASDAIVNRILGQEPDANTLAWTEILTAYSKGDPLEFNQAVAAYRQTLADAPPEQLAVAQTWYEKPFRPVTDFESYFNHLSPFIAGAILYVIAFLLTIIGFVCALFGWHKPFFRASFVLILLTFFFHTLALLARMYISGRPPITNLYSSAIFIGWGAGAAGIMLEAAFRMGIGNVIASVIGLATMIIAYLLAGDGDTMVVMQAVLDTQFWLSTHVVTITLGYLATYVTGLLGIISIIVAVIFLFLTRSGAMSSTDAQSIERIIHKMTFGAVCFAILFSFIGTVLGGLWADDSWGRFWGWDPKENGAAIIVLWNAVLLHARWDRMVAVHGFAVLAVIGNIVTSWSWFGVNELGVGLHSYGFTEGVLLALGLFVVSQLLIIGVGICVTKPGRALFRKLFGD
ncbi:MAG: cytochrome c biogenesis protein CcsA [Pirellulaceae bacterium]